MSDAGLCEWLDPDTAMACHEPGHVVELVTEDRDSGVEIRYVGHLCDAHEARLNARHRLEPA